MKSSLIWRVNRFLSTVVDAPEVLLTTLVRVLLCPQSYVYGHTLTPTTRLIKSKLEFSDPMVGPSGSREIERLQSLCRETLRLTVHLIQRQMVSIVTQRILEKHEPTPGHVIRISCGIPSTHCAVEPSRLLSQLAIAGNGVSRVISDF